MYHRNGLMLPKRYWTVWEPLIYTLSEIKVTFGDQFFCMVAVRIMPLDKEEQGFIALIQHNLPIHKDAVY